MTLDARTLKKDWAGFVFDVAKFEVREDVVLSFAHACGETDPRFIDPSHEDFQAPTTFPASFVGARMLPRDFPRFGKAVFDAGKCVLAHRPIRVGDTLVGTSTLHDIYEKTGRSGTMVFLVHRMEFKNQADAVVSVVDWRMVVRI